MATNLVKVKQQTAIVWANSTDYSGAVSGLARTHQLDLTSLASGAARQAAQADLGVTRWPSYLAFAGIEIASSAASNEQIDFYWAGSVASTAANANPGGTTGSDAAYTGTAGDSLADSLLQLEEIGPLITTADDTPVVQYQIVGVLDGMAIHQYGMPVVVNNSSGALMSDAVEMFFALLPIAPDIQAAT